MTLKYCYKSDNIEQFDPILNTLLPRIAQNIHFAQFDISEL